LTFSGASEAVPDRQGRIMVPPYLREYAAIDAECVIVGVGHAIEVWSQAGWNTQLQLLNDPEIKRSAVFSVEPGARPWLAGRWPLARSATFPFFTMKCSPACSPGPAENISTERWERAAMPPAY
jgi:hypothetical protein